MSVLISHQAFRVEGEESKHRTGWISRILSRRVASHILFWTLLFLINSFYVGYNDENWKLNIISFSLLFPFILTACYINLYYLLPRYYYKGRLWKYILFLAALILGINTLNLSLLDATIHADICPRYFQVYASFTPENFFFSTFAMSVAVGLTSGIKLSKDHFAQKQRAESIEKEKLLTELSFLRSQMQPHFFFNTLNNLYALTIKKSDLAPEVVLKLSDLMSYVLYESEREKTAMLSEIAHIKNYIDLETLRFGNQLEVNFEINGQLEGKSIPPLLLLPFIENSFKHSVGGQLGEILIEILLEVTETDLKLTVRNPCFDAITEKKGGIGLKNVMRRLDLIYGSRYQLHREQTNGAFIIHLQLPLL